MAFPASRLPVTVEIAPGADLSDASAGWVYTDITSRVRFSKRRGRYIRISQGADDEAPRVEPSRCTMWLDNRSGDFTPRNPLGAYYGSLGRNTPLRVSIRRADDDFDRTASSGWGTEPLWGGTWTVSGGSASDYSVSSGTGRQSLGTTNTWRHSLLDVGVTDARITVDVTNPVVPTGATISHRVLGRVTDTNNYYTVQLGISTAGGATVALLRRVAGVETSVTGAVSVGTHSAGDTWRIVLDYRGTSVRAKAWETTASEPTSWQVEATDTNLTTGSQVGLAAIRVTGNTNGTVVVTHGSFTVDVDRFSGFVSAWPPRWDKSGRDATVPIEANGVLRRLGQGASPLRSALYRSITSAATLPIAYWPLEDGIDSTQAASGLLGGTPMTVAAGIMDFIDTGPTGSAGSAQPEVDAANQLIGSVPGGSATAWQVSVWTRGQLVDGATGLAFYMPLKVVTTNDKIIRLIIESSGNHPAGVAQYDSETQTIATNTCDVVTGVAYDFQDGDWHLLQATFTQVGSDVEVTFNVDGTTWASSATWAGLTLGAPSRVNAIDDFSAGFGAISAQMQEIQVAHIGVWNTATLVDQYDAGLGYVGEAAHDRIARLCDEQGVSVTVLDGDFETPMGPQSTGTLLDLLQECADADHGVLHESGFGLGYVPRGARYNRTADLALDFDQGQIADPPEPADDDQQLRNDVTARRKDGSTGRYVDEESVSAAGRYDEEVTVNVATDTVLVDHAAWLVHLGTVDEMRWPRLDINLAASPELIDDWLACGVQSRVTAANPPDEVAGDDIDVIVEGYSETLGHKDWSVEPNCSPAQPWDVGVYGTSRYDTEGSELAAQYISGTHTTMSVATTEGARWVTGAVDLDLNVGGVRVNVTNISGTSSPQTFTVTQTPVNGVVKTVPSGTAVSLWRPAVYAL